MIYIVQRWYISEFEEYVDTVLVTTNRDKAFMVCKEMQKLYPNDDIDIAEWQDGEIPYCYKFELGEVND